MSEEITKHIKKAFVYKSAGNFKQAIESFYKALELDSENPEILSEIAGLYFELNNNDKAIRYY
ncbi:tetratricopeptide repeat protein [bacterium]|nr:tetratricopeptide repeat protein [bacterium]